MTTVEKPEPKVYKSRIIESYPAWHVNVGRYSKSRESNPPRPSSYCAKENSWGDKQLEEDEKSRQRKEHFNAWIQEKNKKDKDLKMKQKRAEETAERVKRDREEIQSKIRTIMKEEWLKKKSAQEREELEKKKYEKELEVMEKKRKEIISRIKVNQWMKKSNSRKRPVDQSLHSASNAHITFVNPEPWRSNLDDD